MTRPNARFSATPVALLTVLAIIGCNPGTVRPAFPPVIGAARVEVELRAPQATEILGEILRGDTIPLTRVDTRDGLIESAWFRVADKKPDSGRPVGPETVRVRAWVDPSRSGHSYITIETVFHPVADPSLTSRQLDQHVPADHPIGKRMLQIVTEMARLYGDPEAATPAAPPAEKKPVLPTVE